MQGPVQGRLSKAYAFATEHHLGEIENLGAEASSLAARAAAQAKAAGNGAELLQRLADELSSTAAGIEVPQVPEKQKTPDLQRRVDAPRALATSFDRAAGDLDAPKTGSPTRPTRQHDRGREHRRQPHHRRLDHAALSSRGRDPQRSPPRTLGRTRLTQA